MRDPANIITVSHMGNQQCDVFFLPASGTVHSANRQVRIVAVWDSPVLSPSVNFLRWNQIDWSAVTPNGTALKFWVRFSANLTEWSEWQGPYLNATGEALPAGERHLQIRASLSGSGWPAETGSTPSLSRFTARCILAGESGSFYTAAFELGFVPTHALVTYNGEIPDGAVVRAAITAQNTADATQYLTVLPGEITSLDTLSNIEPRLKVMLQILGRRDVAINITGLAIAAIGPGQTKLA